jgi:hypothetical protein
MKSKMVVRAKILKRWILAGAANLSESGRGMFGVESLVTGSGRKLEIG